MQEFGGSAIFWLITVGLLVGGIMKICMGNRGIGIAANVLGGVLISVICGFIAYLVSFPGGLAFGAIGTMGSLFLANIFHMIGQHTHPEGHSPL